MMLEQQIVSSNAGKDQLVITTHQFHSECLNASVQCLSQAFIQNLLDSRIS